LVLIRGLAKQSIVNGDRITPAIPSNAQVTPLIRGKDYM